METVINGDVYHCLAFSHQYRHVDDDDFVISGCSNGKDTKHGSNKQESSL